mgnify:CR=1 FL=1
MPVLIHNHSKERADEVTRKAFSEPAWNNPVVRFLGPTGEDLIPRKDGVWTRAGILAGMIEALEADSRKVPRWLRVLTEEAVAHARGVERAVFGMT